VVQHLNKMVSKRSAVAFRQDYSNLTDKLPVCATYLPFTARTELHHHLLVNEQVRPAPDLQHNKKTAPEGGAVFNCEAVKPISFFWRASFSEPLS
jgi:hypothetical protein